MELHLLLSPDGEIKVGTCQHCVIHEQGRPERAWDADGDRELDFDRDELLARLAAFGVVATVVEEYVCP
jgi:hypothetical protein